jgi:hypothetical protein
MRPHGGDEKGDELMSATTRIVLSVALAALFSAPATAIAAQKAVKATVPGGSRGLARVYTGEDVQMGRFKGELRCLNDHFLIVTNGVEGCPEKGFINVLTESGDQIHPVLAATGHVFDRLNAGGLQGKKVEVEGRYYPTTGMILADKIALQR